METPNKIIAVVDDDPGMRETLESLLSATGYCAQLYASAAEFLAVADTTEAACLILDIELGAVSGIDLARKLAASGFSFPILFMTGSDDQQFRRDAIDLGCVAYLLKPFRSEQLMSAIAKATERTSSKWKGETVTRADKPAWPTSMSNR